MSEKIEVKNISKVFGQNGMSHEVLRKISFDIQVGEFVCIVGSSGAGKSTLLKILSSIEKPTYGEIHGMPDKISFVFQNFALFPWLDVSQNIGFGLKMAGIKPQTIKKIVREQIDIIGLAGFETAHPKELSGGMRQRVGIARAMAVEPKLLMLDEPFSSLDEITAKKLRTDLLGIWQAEITAKTVLMVTHLIEEAVELADRIIVMGHDPGTINKVINNPLPRPRNMRSKAAFDLIDEITKNI